MTARINLQPFIGNLGNPGRELREKPKGQDFADPIPPLQEGDWSGQVRTKALLSTQLWPRYIVRRLLLVNKNVTSNRHNFWMDRS